MTRRRIDSHSTEFGLWLRNQNTLDSQKYGYVATNLDYVWENYKLEKYMLIEEKRYNNKLTFSQSRTFKRLHRICNVDKNYCGFYVIIFEKTNPDDGKIWINTVEVNKNELMQLLKFNVPKKIPDLLKVINDMIIK